MCAAQNPQPPFGYTWGFADNGSRTAESVLEISPNINYTVSGESMPYLLSTDGSLAVQKDVKGALTGNKGNVVRRMYVVNDPSFPPGTQRVITTGGGSSVVKKQDSQQQVLSLDKNCDILPGISVQVQKVIQGLEENEDSQGDAPNLKLEPGTLELSPKTELQESMHFSETDATIKKERPYSCDECGKSFLLKHHLTTHARVHTGERPHICSHCGKSFAHKHCLNTHLLLHSTDRPYQCQECKKSFTLKHHLLTHSRVHSRERPFVCQECGRAFPLKRHLVTHSKFHAGERPYVCEECGESFAQENHLIMHSRFHGSLNPFVCAECGASFPRKFQLVNHGRIHGKIPHSCTVCGKEFLQKRTLVSHMRRVHTGEQAHPCVSCGEGFLTKAELHQHVRAAHNGVNPNTSSATIIANQQLQQPHHHPGQHPQTITVVSNPGNSTLLTVSTTDANGVARPQFVCRECGSAFNSREALALHLRLHTGDKSLMTDLCALTAALPGHFLSTASLNPGTVVTANPNLVGQNPVPVQIISSTGQVMSQTTLVQAANSTHPQAVVTAVPTMPVHQQQHMQHVAQQQQQQQQQQHVVNVVPANKPKSHFCASCGKGFAAKHGLMQHNRRHPNGGCTVRTHVCECGKAFFQKNHLMLHQRQHLETKPAISQQQEQQQQEAAVAASASGQQPVQVQILPDGHIHGKVIKYEICRSVLPEDQATAQQQQQAGMDVE
ncbi:zinc finger protein 189 isoform X16 [Drosophila miranda]|uniref:Zinc finger protein 189 isoform X17 n=1 Tax=Drosophila pseudoobscura pseudoobscura TaxID=46245 RepID=A0A6I8VGD3_DROPS|nr:zinc finger protein 189 isoform X17 [Drosophila pseudoobscura]XP_017146366.1 zinc finger protein 189 isoform X16 [Drosophila miranda]XP_026840694.1 zinc finger protein 189 isoform X18 [Drosophila persimilis]